MARRLTPLLVALALVAAACSSSDATDDTTSPTEADVASTSSTLPELPTFDDDDVAFGVDEAVRIGTLSNGLTYYIRENDSPGGRAQLRLVVKAGSALEDPAQRGVAHFLEHMAFNGTERFPTNELVLLLQRFGAEFGPEINAYVSYEETVYKLELPTDDDETVASGFDVLQEWASAITLDQTEIDLERGVLVEEWRLRDQGFWGRYFTAVGEVLLAGSPYADLEPLATPEEVAETTRDGLVEYYERWYRPDTMAIVAVGDFDADAIEELIRRRFEDLSPKADTPQVPALTTEPFADPAFLVLTDPEYPQAWAELNYPLPALDGSATIGSYRTGLAFDLAWDMIVARLEEQSIRSDTPFFDPSFAANPLVRGQRSPGLAAFAEPGDLLEATEALLREVRRAELHGFGPLELQRALDERRSAVELAYDERATTQDAAYADQYVEHFLAEVPIPDADEWRDAQLRILDEMTPEIVASVFTASLAPTEPFVILVAPDSAADVVPDEDALADLVARIDTEAVDPWVEEADAIETLMERPDATEITDRGRFSDTGLTELTLANGLRVVFLPTTIRDDVVVVRAASPGGWAVVDPAHAAEAQLASSIATTSGLGDFDQIELDRFLTRVSAAVTPYVDETIEGFAGESATDDVETLLQLIHLYMTSPRFEARAADVVVAETLPFSADLALIPDLAVETALADARFSGDRRFRPVPPPEDLETLDLATVESVFMDRFDDPGDFVFTFLGDFDEDVLEDLVRRYLGSIPGPGDAEAFRDIRPEPPGQVVDLSVEAGASELGGVTFVFTSAIDLDPATRIEVDLVELILQQRLTDRIREELSASYSPFTFATLIENGEASVEFRIQISGDPNGLDEVVTATLEEVEDLATNGPTDDELAIAREQLRRDYELLSNESLGEAVLFSALHPEEPLTQITARIDQTGDASAGDLRDLAALLLPVDRYVLARLTPAG